MHINEHLCKSIQHLQIKEVIPFNHSERLVSQWCAYIHIHINVCTCKCMYTYKHLIVIAQWIENLYKYSLYYRGTTFVHVIT